MEGQAAGKAGAEGKGVRKRIDMARIGPSRGTRPELLVQGLLKGLFYSCVTANDSSLPGSPDAVVRFPDGIFPTVAVFVDGRFWHDPEYASKRHRAHHTVDWTEKARKNTRRDRLVTAKLKLMDILVIRIWDTSLTGKQRTIKTLVKLENRIRRVQHWHRRGRAIRL